MKKTILTTVSVIALIGALPALAQEAKTQTETNAEASTTGNIVEDAKVAVEDIKSDASHVYEEIKATLIGRKVEDKNTPVVIDSRKTANGIIGHHVYNEKHESVAKVTDIILDKDGKAMMVVVTDGMFGMGKKAALDYSAITRVEEDGDVIIPVTQKTIDNTASFSYDKTKAGEKMHVIPDKGYSVSRLLRGRILNQKGMSIADVHNISFKNGVANQLIVGYDRTLGLGEKKAVLGYGNTKIIRNGDALDFLLSEEKSAQLLMHKKAATN